MLNTYQNPTYPYQRHADQDNTTPAHYPVVIIGAGPIGLASALECAQLGIPCVVLDDNNTVSVGSRAVCYAKRTLEILDRLGIGQKLIDKGITWNLGKVFFKEGLLYTFNLLPEAAHQRPAFINLQQYYLEEYMVEAVGECENVSLRWKNRVTGVEQHANGATVSVDTPDGTYQLSCDYLIVADGANSSVRAMMGLNAEGKVFQDRFLIADVVMKGDFPTERWFWFDPSFHRNQSVLLHKQADDVWRIDFQLGWDADPDKEKQPEAVIPRLKAFLGEETEFELEWTSVYTFQCRRMDKFRHDRVLFVGDAAHQVSPFGARGANSGIQDTDNLFWKLKLVLDNKAPEALLDSYDQERSYAADENLLNSTRSTDFITPKSPTSLTFRNATLMLAKDFDFARKLVNSGRLSLPAVLSTSSLNTPDSDAFAGTQCLGAPAADAPVTVNGEETWLLPQLGGEFVGLYFSDTGAVPEATAVELAALADAPIGVKCYVVTSNEQAQGALPTLVDQRGYIKQRYDGQAGSFYLIRPDQHVCARWRHLNSRAVQAALATATAQHSEA